MAVINFIWDEVSDNVLLETDDSDAVTAAYVNRPEQFGELLSQDRSGTKSFFHYDGESSTSALTDENEDITDTFIYTAYGEEVARAGTTTNPFGYKGAVGYYTDESTSDIYVRNRTFEPAIGRWLSADPIGFVDGSSLYRAYFVPRGVDPLGLMYFRARYYDNQTGEFISRDPLEYVDGMSLYAAYFLLSGLDPSGSRCKTGCDLDGIPSYSEKPCELKIYPGKNPHSRYEKQFNWLFKFKPRSECYCCEYRQHVVFAKLRAEIVRANGDVVDVTDNPFPNQHFPGTNIHIPWEDHNIENPKERYGHRKEPERNNDIYDQPDRLTGCRYANYDAPGVNLTNLLANVLKTHKFNPLKDKIRVKFRFRFISSIIDSCSDNEIIYGRMFDISCEAREFSGEELLPK